MIVAVVGSRSLTVTDERLAALLPADTTGIVTGGADGIDACARRFALGRGLPLTEYLPEYERFGRAAPLVRNRRILERAEFVLVIWDGASRGTAHVIDTCRALGKPIAVYPPD